jgi:Flp pilus assembly protein TadD
MKTKKELSEMTREELEQELMKMPELETMEQADEEIRQFHERQKQMDKIDEDRALYQMKLIHKNMHDINTFQCTTDNELYLRGTDEYGKGFDNLL